MSGKKHNIRSGTLLVSEPFMLDPNFERTVVLMCEHDHNGSLGFVLNKEVEDIRLNDVMDEIGEGDFPLHLGGPVENGILQFIHSLGNEIEHSVKIATGVYWGGNFEQLKFMLREGLVKQNEIKFFLGYSGWGSGQLNEELEQKAWITSNEQLNGVFGDIDQLWKNTLKNMGGKYRVISNYPTDPRLN